MGNHWKKRLLWKPECFWDVHGSLLPPEQDVFSGTTVMVQAALELPWAEHSLTEGTVALWPPAWLCAWESPSKSVLNWAARLLPDHTHVSNCQVRTLIDPLRFALRKLKLGNQESRGIEVICLHDGEWGWRMLEKWEISV